MYLFYELWLILLVKRKSLRHFLDKNRLYKVSQREQTYHFEVYDFRIPLLLFFVVFAKFFFLKYIFHICKFICHSNIQSKCFRSEGDLCADGKRIKWYRCVQREEECNSLPKRETLKEGCVFFG